MKRPGTRSTFGHAWGLAVPLLVHTCPSCKLVCRLGGECETWRGVEARVIYLMADSGVISVVLVGNMQLWLGIEIIRMTGNNTINGVSRP